MITKIRVNTTTKRLTVIDSENRQTIINLETDEVEVEFSADTKITSAVYQSSRKKTTKRIGGYGSRGKKKETLQQPNKGRRLTDDEKQLIQDRKEGSKTSQQVADELGVSLATINRYWIGKDQD